MVHSASSTSSNSLASYDVSLIKGNITDEEKLRCAKTFSRFVSTREKSYGADVGQRLRFVEMNVWGKETSAAYGETVFEIDVTKGVPCIL
jgi:acyl-coenzyme A thioesterase 13